MKINNEQIPQYLFRGYVPLGDGKRPAKEYIDEKIAEYKDVYRGNFAGLLADNYMFVDIDDEAQSELFTKICKEENIGCCIQKTTRGAHYFFERDGLKRNMQKCVTAIGLIVELKCNQNTPTPIKIDGVFREWIQILQEDEIETIPQWLRHNKFAAEYDFKNLQTGERNNTYFRYKGELLRRGFDGKSVDTTIRIINTYITPNPLPKRELDVILRDTEEAKRKTFYLDGKFQHSVFGDFMLNNEKFALIDDQFNVMGENYIYSSNENLMERLMIEKLNPITFAQRQETLRYIKLMCKKRLSLSHEKYIPLKDKVFDIETETFLDYTSQFVFKNKVNFMPNTNCDVVDKTIKKLCCNDPQLELLLEEIIGYGLWRRNELRKCFILTGDRRSGKSTFLTVLKTLYGLNNYSTLSLENLSEKFKVAELDGKMINVGDDIDEKYISDDSNFKKLVSGESVTVERKNKDPYSYTSTVKFYFAANRLPKVNDKGSGFIDRIITFPFNNVFSKEDDDFDPFIVSKLTTDEALGYFLYIGLRGLKRVITNNCFTVPEIVKEQIREYDEDNNPHREFIREHKIENETVKEVYLAYSAWCRGNGYNPMNSSNLGKEIKRELGLKSVLKKLNGTVIRIYIKEVTEVTGVTGEVTAN